jgi:hypothetical protein
MERSQLLGSLGHGIFLEEILNFHRLRTAILGCKLPKPRTVHVKNPYTVLSQKEEQVARVRKEVEALITVIPLLADNPLSWDELQKQLLSSCPDIEHSINDGWLPWNCITHSSGV